MTPWLLLDYCEVISRPYDDTVRLELARRLSLSAELTEERYWAGRPGLDGGDESVGYWSAVAGRPVEAGEARELDLVDLAGWARVDEEMLALVEEQRAAGVRLALLSNAPHVQADAFEQVAWTEPFERIFVSSRLGMVKPDPLIYRHVLDELGVAAADVTFVDDREANVRAAAELGIRAILFTGVAALRAAL